MDQGKESSAFSMMLGRRQVLAGMAGVGALSLGLVGLPVGRAGAQDSATPEATGLGQIPTGGANADGTWSFTDDRGVETTRDTTPTKVVAYIGIAAALFDLGFEVTGFFSGESREAVDPAKLAPNLPMDRVINLGYADALDVEQLISLGTELVVGPNYGVDGGQTIWPITEEAMDQIEQFAGVVAIAFADGTDTRRTIESISNLAGALGAELESDANVAAKEGFDTAVAELEAAIAANADLTALFMTGANDGYYVGGDLADVNLYRQSGLAIYGVDGFDIQSWESFADTDVDVIFLDNRGPGWLQPDQLEAQIPVWPLHPAVVAGQVFPWQNEYVPSYLQFTPIIQAVTEAISSSTVLA